MQTIYRSDSTNYKHRKRSFYINGKQDHESSGMIERDV